jgi:hypothetical protein
VARAARPQVGSRDGEDVSGLGLAFRLLIPNSIPATQPGPCQGKKKDHGFKVSADGRLIIREEEDGDKVEEEEGTKGRAMPVLGGSCLWPGP